LEFPYERDPVGRLDRAQRRNLARALTYRTPVSPAREVGLLPFEITEIEGVASRFVQPVGSLAHGREEVHTKPGVEESTAACIAQCQDPTTIRVVLEGVGRRLDRADARFMVGGDGNETGIPARRD